MNHSAKGTVKIVTLLLLYSLAITLIVSMVVYGLFIFVCLPPDNHRSFRIWVILFIIPIYAYCTLQALRTIKYLLFPIKEQVVSLNCRAWQSVRSVLNLCVCGIALVVPFLDISFFCHDFSDWVLQVPVLISIIIFSYSEISVLVRRRSFSNSKHSQPEQID